MISEAAQNYDNEDPSMTDFSGRGESEKMEITAPRPAKSLKKKKSSKRSERKSSSSKSEGNSLRDESSDRRKKKKKKKDKKKKSSQQQNSTLMFHEGEPSAMMGESSASMNLSSSRHHYDSSGSFHYEHSPKIEEMASTNARTNRLPPSSSRARPVFESSPLQTSQRSAQLKYESPKVAVFMDESEDLSIASEEDDRESVVAISPHHSSAPRRVPSTRPVMTDSSDDDNSHGQKLAQHQRPVSATNLFSSSVAHSMRRVHRSPPGHSPILARKTLMDDLASFAEASLGTSIGDNTSDLMSISGSTISNSNTNHHSHYQHAISSTDAVTHELLVSYMLSMGAPRENAESLAFAFMSQQKTSQRAASTRDVTSTVHIPPHLTASMPADTQSQDTISIDSMTTARSTVTHKLEYIRGAASARRASSTRSIRDDISAASSIQASRRQRPQNYIRADGPGAVEMEGRAFGAPLRMADFSIHSRDSNMTHTAGGTVNNDFSDQTNLIVEAMRVQSDDLPVVYADSSPLSVKYLFQRGPIRRVVLVGIVLLAFAIAIICYFLLVGQRSENDQLRNENTLSPSSTPTLVSDEILNFAASVSGEDVLNDPDSPQFRAVSWLSTYDQVDPEGYGKPFLQRYILVTFFFSTNGDNWLERDNWLNPKLNTCDWSSGIWCKSDISKKLVVVGIDLIRNGLSGVLPNELGLLANLESLRLEKNSIVGTLPASIYDLSELKILNIGSNGINGQFPDNVGNATELTDLDLSDNDLSGVLPSSIWNLSLLRLLDLSQNQISGTITDRVNRLTKLVRLDLKRNLFSGMFPRDIEKMAKLDFLRLDYNKLTGSLPTLTAGFITTQEISFSHNLLTGTLPDLNPLDVFAINDRVSLSRLDISHNMISGTINSAVSLLSTLQTLDVSSNRFTNEFPMTSGGWSAIESLAAADNFFTGTISSAFPPSLKYFDMSGNDFDGMMPTELCNFPNLEFLRLSRNRLGGTIPPCISKLNKLRAMEIAGAGLNGPIPEGIRQLRDLTILDLSNNTLTGSLPSTVDQLMLLSQLHLNDNILSGKIPSVLGKLTFLRQLQLSNNEFSGSIPFTLSDLSNLEGFSVSGNNALTGMVPQGLCELSAIIISAENVGCNVECMCCQDANEICG